MKTCQTILICIACIILTSCASMQNTANPIITKNGSLDNYKFIYINPTKEITINLAKISTNNNSGYGTSKIESLLPSDVISGYLLKKGFVPLENIEPELLDETLIINYGESRRKEDLLGYTIEVTIQFTSANNKSIVCVTTAEEQRNSEIACIRSAIHRALDALFETK